MLKWEETGQFVATFMPSKSMANAMSAKWENVDCEAHGERHGPHGECHEFWNALLDFSSRWSGFWLPRHGQRHGKLHGECHECNMCPFSPLFALFVPISRTKALSWKTPELNTIHQHKTINIGIKQTKMTCVSSRKHDTFHGYHGYKWKIRKMNTNIAFISNIKDDKD